MSEEKTCSVTLCDGGIWECQKAELEEKLRVVDDIICKIQGIAMCEHDDYQKAIDDIMDLTCEYVRLKGGSEWGQNK